MQVDPDQISPAKLYHHMVRLITPRPIAWVSSISRSGAANLAPFSYFNAAGTSPPVVMFCPANRADGSKKDTLRNVEETGQFVVNIVTEELAGVMNQTSGEYPADVDEHRQVEIETVPSATVQPPRVAAAKAAFECTVHSIQHLGTGPLGTNIVLGRIKLIHISDALLDDNGRLDADKLMTIGRLGGPTYCRTSDRFEMPRPEF